MTFYPVPVILLKRIGTTREREREREREGGGGGGYDG